MKKWFTLSLVLLFISASLFAQNSTQGMEFWFSYMENGYKYNAGNWVDNTVMISAKRACSFMPRRSPKCQLADNIPKHLNNKN